jgi:enamine deaminase RidA (YjgF/YER057c/UK114 family)
MENDSRTISKATFVESIAYLLRETFEGSPEGQPSAYLDRGIGMFSTLDGLTSEQASAEVGGTTAAAHAEHAKFYLDRLCEFINGRSERVNWDDSWLIDTVDENEWIALRSSVKNAYENSLRCLAGVDGWTDVQIGMAIGLVAHTAYHLGAIRQITKSK